MTTQHCILACTPIPLSIVAFSLEYAYRSFRTTITVTFTIFTVVFVHDYELKSGTDQ